MRLVASFFLFLVSLAASAQTASFPPSPKVLLAVNPITNKVYSVNEFSNSVTVFDAAAGTSKVIAVGSRPQFIAVNPITNRIYVNNGGEASVSVIDGSTDTNITPTPLQVGSQGPMAINAETNVVYIVRMTSVATDEVTFLNGNDNTWYTIATESFQPTAVTINPVTNTLYVAHYGTGDVRVISGAYNNTVLHPTTFSIGAWSKPFAIAANPSNNKIYVITEDARGPIGIIDGATRTAQFPVPTPGHGAGPKSVVVNPTTGVAYAAFNGEVIAITGTSYTYIPVTTGAGQVGLAVNALTNKVYVSSESGTLTVIDGDNNTTTTFAIPAGAQSVAVNPVTNEVIVHGPTPTIVNGTGTPHGSLISTTITAQPGNTAGPNPTFTINATNFSSNPLPIRGVFVQMDGRDGAWTAASGGGGTYTASFSGLANGSHTLNAFAIEGQVAPIATGPESMPLVGALASYTFTVGTATKADPRVSLLSSGNPSNAGQSVTFTASVIGNGTNAPTGTMAFKDGATTLCAAVTIASGSATCSSTLVPGAHTITATYSGDTNYNTASATLTQTVNKAASTTTVTSSVNPSNVGQSVTFTAAVTGGTGTPTGTVTFTDGATTLCPAVSLTSGSATCTTSALASGSRSINAAYSGDTTRNTSNGSVTQTVNLRDATAFVTSSINPSSSGQSVTFTATVSGGGGTPTGTVTFMDGVTTLCSAVPLASGLASCTLSSLAVGNHTIAANYSGSTTYKPSSGSVTQTVNKAQATVSVSASPSMANIGQSVTLTATLSGGSIAPTGSVAFLDGSTVISGCSAVTISSGSAACATSFSTAGSHVITAQYSGDSAYNATTSTGTSVTVNSPSPATPAAMSTPAPGSTLAGASQTFAWNNAGADVYQIWIGNSVGSYDIGAFPPGGTAATSATVSGLPTDGRTLYVRLYSSFAGVLTSRDYTYTAATVAAVAPASMLTPAAGSALTGSTQTFTWNNAGAQVYQVWIGNAVGSYDIGAYPPGGTAATSATVSGLPTDGRTLYVRLYSSFAGVLYSRDYTYQAASAGGPTPAALLAPAAGSTLSGATQTFTWNSAGASLYQVWVGNAVGSYDIGAYPPGGTAGTSATVSGLPTDGRTLYVRLYSSFAGTLYSRDYTYTAANAPSPTAAAILTPAPGSTLSGASQTFTWSNTGAEVYQVWIGNAVGSYDIGAYPPGGTAATTAAVSGLPTDGRTLYVRLYSSFDGVLYWRDYTYRSGP